MKKAKRKFHKSSLAIHRGPSVPKPQGAMRAERQSRQQIAPAVKPQNRGRRA